MSSRLPLRIFLRLPDLSSRAFSASARFAFGLLAVAGVAFATASAPVIERLSYGGEIERTASERPHYGEPDELAHQAYKNFQYTWLQVRGLGDAEVERSLNQQLRALIDPAERPPAAPAKAPRRPADDAYPDEFVEVTHATIKADTLTVVVERGHRHADAPRHMLQTDVHHYDLGTGRELTFADFFPRERWPALEKDLRRAFDALNDQYLVYTSDEFASPSDHTNGYFSNGLFHLLVRSSRDTSAVQDRPFLEVPAGLLLRWLSPRGRALLAECVFGAPVDGELGDLHAHSLLAPTEKNSATSATTAASFPRRLPPSKSRPASPSTSPISSSPRN